MLIGRRKTFWLFAASAVMTGFVVLLWALGTLRSFELSTVDTRFAIRGDLPAREYRDIAIVSIDDKTFDDLQQRWPFPRSLQAKAIDQLSKAGAKVIVEDIQYTEPSEDPDEDYALAESIGRAGNVVLATTEVDAKTGATNVLGGDDNVKSFNATVGISRVPFDPAAVVRRFDHERSTRPSLSVAAVERGTGKKVSASRFHDNTAWINYVGPAGTIPRIPFSDVVQGNFDPKDVRGKYVVVGATNDTLHDIYRTSTAKAMAGPEIHANAIATILGDFSLQSAGWFLTLLIVLLFGFAEPLLNLRFAPMGAFLVSLAGGVFYALIALYAFSLGYILPVTYPLIALALSMVATLSINFLAAAFERERTRAEFARFAPDSVVEQVLSETDGAKLGGKRVEATVLFSDLRGFTSFSEKLTPEQVIGTLNDYLSEMSEAILDNKGTLVSFMGDGIMAVFGAPIETPHHADHALDAAREMLARMESFNERMREAGLGGGFKMGIGLNTGPVMSGNVGSERRLEYTAIGDTTNTAARLEGATKGTPFQLFISGSTRAALSEPPPADFEWVEEMSIRGREQKLEVWGLVEREAAAATAAHERSASE